MAPLTAFGPSAALILALTAAKPGSADLPSPACFDSDHFSADVWSFCRPVAPGIFLYYTPTNEDGNALLGLRAPSHSDGWSSLALAGNGGMKGASQIVVRREDGGAGEWIAEDRYSDDYVTPELDDSQDVQLIFAEQSEDLGTSWGVMLRSESCDERDYPVVDRSVWMHWALGSSHDFFFHGNNRGQFHANLMRAPPSDAAAIEPRGSLSESGEVIDVVNVVVPDVDVVMGEGGADPKNPYICSIFDLEEVKKEHEIEHAEHIDVAKIHITGFSPIIDPDSEKYVHHMIVYSCDVESADEGAFVHKKVVQECGSMPSGCQEMKWAWAVGGMDTTLPPNVGIPVGGEGSSRWLAIQMHYYNPNEDEGVKDSSGVRVHFTSQLREHDAGFLQLAGGVRSFQREPMPAGQSTYVLDPAFVVPSTCTDWDEPLNILGVAHHEHQVGKKMTIEVQREGRNLGPMRLERVFDFNHHSSEESAIPQLMPGDEIVMNCEYDTSSRTKDVEFGEGSQDEMCYAILFYYPLKTNQDWAMYLPMEESTKSIYEMACSSPGSGEGFTEVSMCAEYYMIDIATFLGVDLGFKLGAAQLCNSPMYNRVERAFPGTCPPCASDQSCTEEEVMEFGQNVLCPKRCKEFGGLTAWPDTSVTKAAVTHSAMCGNGVMYFEHTPIEAEVCEVRGDLNVAPLEVDPSSSEDEGAAPADGGATPAGNGAGVASLSVVAFVAVVTTTALF